MDRTGHVGLFLHREQILELDSEQAAGRPRQEGVNRDGQGLEVHTDDVIPLHRRQTFPFKRSQQSAAIVLPRLFLSPQLRIIEKPDRSPLPQVGSHPPTVKRCKVMRCRTGKGGMRPLRRRLEVTNMCPLERQHAIALHFHLSQHVAESRSDRSKVLSDDDC